MQCSIALDKNTPLLRSARNLDGIVSRFLASRLCSKVPVKAKAHVSSRSGREVSRSRVAEWEEPRHPGTASHRQSTPLRPTLQHRTRFASHIVQSWTRRPRKSRLFAGTFSWDGFRADRRSTCSVRFIRAICTSCCGFEALARPFGGRSGRNWPQRVVSAGISAAATSNSTAGTSRSATTSWIFGAALAACSDRWAALSERASAAWAASVVPSGAPCRSARLSAATSCAMPVAGLRRLELRQRPLGRLAHRGAVGGALELLREHTGVAPADLLQRPPRREAGGDRDPQQVQHVGQLGLHQLPARAGAPAQRVLGGEVAADGSGEQRSRGRGGRARAWPRG